MRSVPPSKTLNSTSRFRREHASSTSVRVGRFNISSTKVVKREGSSPPLSIRRTKTSKGRYHRGVVGGGLAPGVLC